MLLRMVSLWCMISFWFVEADVLDPSLYLSPSPPLTDTSESVSPAVLWSRSANSKITSDRNSKDNLRDVLEEKPTQLKRKPGPMERAKLFWPSARPSHYSVGTGNIQIPLTFSLSGIYGKYAPGSLGTGIIGSTYGTVSEVAGTAVSGLAGSGYGNYRTYQGLRIYSGENGPAWSGWGNGKWGHYGKG